MRRRERFFLGTAATIAVLVLVALFSSPGSSALARGKHTQAAAAAQQRCTNRAVRGIAVVTGDPRVGIANLPSQFTSSRAVFARTFNCTGRAVQVHRVGIGLYDVRFVGNRAPTAIANGIAGGQASAELAVGGIFRVSVHPAGRADPDDRGFVIVVV